MITREEIIRYYKECLIDYEIVWRLRRTGALHYGYWAACPRFIRMPRCGAGLWKYGVVVARK